MRKVFITLLSLIAMGATAQDIEKFPWLNRNLSFRERATLLVKELSLEEKAGQFGSIVTEEVKRGDVVILPHYQYWNEAIHGYARMGNATSFPESKGMSATWDPELVYQCADAISTEARAYHMYKTNQRNSLVKGWKIGLNVWSPTINMARDPRWGREEENYGEDPFLCGTLATQFVKGMQGTQTADNPYFKIVACAKHFAANNYEAGRHSTTSFVTEKNMREYYLPAFEMCVKDGNVQSIMAAYNSISTDLNETDANNVGYSQGKGGLPCSGNKMLLTDILRKEWGFKGYVTSDCAAVSDVYRSTKHLYFGNYTAGTIATGAAEWKDPYKNSTDSEKMMEARATALCLNAGLNSNCEQYSSSAVLQRALVNAVSSEYKAADELGYVNLSQETVDNALIELLTTRFALGEFDEDYENIAWNNVAATDIESETNQALALKAAQESMTLMKNEGSILPIPSGKKVALVGPYANAIQLGDYSGTPTYTTTPYEAFAKKMNFVAETHRTGEIAAVPFDQAIVSKRGAANNDKGAGNLENTAPGDIFLYKDVDFGEYGCTNFTMSCGAKNTGLGQVSFILDSKDGTPFLTVSNVDTGNWTKWTTVTADVDPTVVKGTHDLYVKFSGSLSYVGNYQYFNFTNPDAPAVIPAEETQGPLYMVTTSAGVNEAATQSMIDRAVAVAQKADYVIFLGGTDWTKPASHETGTEGHDRWVLTLPGNQAQLINALHDANPNTIVVLESGSCLDLSAISGVPAILEAWYGGQAQGQAICDAIFGDINPSGHLTSTWYADVNELPQASESQIGKNGANGMLEYNIDDWGYTYMYYGKATKKQQKGIPQFPFGHGLSYTTFAYTDATATTPSQSANGVVNVTIKNTGDRRGADVIQIYADFNGDANYGNLNKRLVGFQRVELDPQEEKTVQIPVSYRSLAYYSEATHQFLVDGQSVKLQVSTSSADADVQKTCSITPAPGVAEETYISTHIDEIPAVRSARQLLQSDHIYSVMGAYLCSATDFDKLPNGIYVLNGVKYIKK
ncbi:MAG: glycoside hydrolase family 3 C-terminal domain-containing protein [Prevotella sp.]|nr:glycoside hydrolase family 3 C-terminal domain-containing protein [Prevotella sp.]